ncbi:unnamed protein product [Ambrosiozyma monospora]|uniref:Unnamed protein product n=1 Tax=Ambrosiozyma monospora TaxID=43982 RepID=A0ACB5TQS2_AMBMO|nr:unnamed protein product [Ambrosiozyma monospora]
MPSRRFDRFFDSKDTNKQLQTFEDDHLAKNCTLIEIPSENIISYAHYGYVYAMETISNINELDHPLGGIIQGYHDILISAGGDGEVKVWGLNNDNIMTLLRSLDCEDSVLSLFKDKSEVTLYCGLTDGGVKVWDLSTFQLIKSYEGDEGDINSVALYNNYLLKGTANEGATKWLAKGEAKCSWSTHKGQSCLALKVFEMQGVPYLVTAGTDKTVELWNLLSLDATCEATKTNSHLLPPTSVNQLLDVLSTLVSFKTVSKHPELYIEESRKCANFLRLLSKKLGAAQSLLLPVPDANPVVYSLFKANKPKPDGVVPRVLWYGHYDVIEVGDNDRSWDTDPFKLTPINGYLYSRGASDNKGPLLAAIYAKNQDHMDSRMLSHRTNP